MLLLVTLLSLQATAPASTSTSTSTSTSRPETVQALSVAGAQGVTTHTTTPLSLIDLVGGEVLDDGAISDSLQTATRRKPAARKKPVRRAPTKKRVVKSSEPSPLEVGLAGAGGAAIGTTVGLAGIVVAGLFATQLVGEQPPEVVIATGAVAIGIAVATPFMAGLGGGAGVLLADDRATPDEWSGLLQCASSGYCAGIGAVAGTLLGGGVGCAPQSCLNMPGPDRPAEWTAAAAIGGLVAGSLLGVVAGYTLAPDKSDPTIAIGVGTISGALLGSASFAGVAGGIAANLRR